MSKRFNSTIKKFLQILIPALVLLIFTVSPAQAVITEQVTISMRDGQKLRGTVYRPGSGIYPIVLSHGHTWWSKEDKFNQAGYAVLEVNTRSIEFVKDVNDSYDLIDWIINQSWSNGKVAMIGISRSAATSWGGARSGHPALKAIFPTSISPEPWKTMYRESGTIQLAHAMNSRAVNGGSKESQWWYLPLIDMDNHFRGEENPIWNNYVSHSSYDDYWQAIDLHGKYNLINIPVYQSGGWYDNYPEGTLTAWKELDKQGLAENRVRINNRAHMGDQNEHDEAIRFFDYVLKGINNGIQNQPPIHLYVQGKGWRYENEWPLARTNFTNYYFHSSSGARVGSMNTSPPGNETATAYTYDPNNPKPALGASCSYTDGSYPEWISCSPKNHSSNESRSDVLIFSTEVLSEDMEITGPVEVKLWAKSDATDTDFTAVLLDVHPNGNAFNMAEGVIRARFRQSIWQSPTLINPGQIYEYTIRMDPVANVFKAGHRIRVHVSSSSFPLWDRNPNTGHDIGMDSEMKIAHQTLYHDSVRPSHIILPIVSGSPPSPSPPTPTPSEEVPGDANGDGKADGLDYIIWLNHFGQSTPNGARDGDFSGNGTVGTEDYAIWLANFTSP